MDGKAGGGEDDGLDRVPSGNGADSLREGDVVQVQSLRVLATEADCVAGVPEDVQPVVQSAVKLVLISREGANVGCVQGA